VNNVKEVIGALVASTKSLNPGEASFFKLLDTDIVITEEDAKVKANVVYGFNSYRSTIIS
jgi:hypothetical protein